MEWDRLEYILFSLDKYLFIGFFILLITAVRIENKVSSVLITFTVVAITNGVMTSLVPVLYTAAANDGVTNKFIWFGTFCLADVIAIYLLYKFHLLLKQNVSSVAIVAAVAFLLLASIQSGFFIEKYWFETNVMTVVYRYGIPLINLLLLPSLLFLWIAEKRTARQLLREAI